MHKVTIFTRILRYFILYDITWNKYNLFLHYLYLLCTGLSYWRILNWTTILDIRSEVWTQSDAVKGQERLRRWKESGLHLTLDNWLHLPRTQRLRVQLIRLYIFQDVLSSEECTRQSSAEQTDCRLSEEGEDGSLFCLDTQRLSEDP